MAGRNKPEQFGVETIHLDLPALSGAFGRRLHAAGLPVTAERAAAFARLQQTVAPKERADLFAMLRQKDDVQVGRVDLEDFVTAQALHANSQCSFGKLKLRRAIVEIQKRKSGVGPETNGGGAELQFSA